MPLEQNTNTNMGESPHVRTAVHDMMTVEQRHVHDLLTTEGAEKQRAPGKAFFEMQVRFAENIARVLPTTLEDALLRYTCIYRRLGQPHPLNAQNPVWREFLSLIQSGEPAAEAAYSLFLEQPCDTEKTTQCFSYGYDEESHAVDIHFANNDPHEKGPLSDERMEMRLLELKSIFRDILEKHPDAKTVRGSSWIYNLANYRRLFPPVYTAELGTPTPGFSGMAPWGQFIDRTGGMRSDKAETFLAQVEKAQSKSEIIKAFPLPQRSALADIESFYTFYGIQ